MCKKHSLAHCRELYSSKMFLGHNFWYELNSAWRLPGRRLPGISTARVLVHPLSLRLSCIYHSCWEQKEGDVLGPSRQGLRGVAGSSLHPTRGSRLSKHKEAQTKLWGNNGPRREKPGQGRLPWMVLPPSNSEHVQLQDSSTQDRISHLSSTHRTVRNNSSLLV